MKQVKCDRCGKTSGISNYELLPDDGWNWYSILEKAGEKEVFPRGIDLCPECNAEYCQIHFREAQDWLKKECKSHVKCCMCED